MNFRDENPHCCLFRIGHHRSNHCDFYADEGDPDCGVRAGAFIFS